MPNSSTPQLLHSSTSPPPTEAQLDDLAAAIHHNRPLPDLNLSETQLALLVDTEPVARRLRALEKLTRARHDAADRESQRAAELEALATLRKCMKSDNPTHALRAAIAIYRKAHSPPPRERLPRGGSNPPPSPGHRPPADEPHPALTPPPAPASSAPTKAPEPSPHSSPVTLLFHQLHQLHTAKPSTSRQAFDLLQDDLTAATQFDRPLSTFPGLTRYLKHLDTQPHVEGLASPTTDPTHTSARVVLPLDPPLRFHFHYTTDPNTAPRWALDNITLDDS